MTLTTIEEQLACARPTPYGKIGRGGTKAAARKWAGRSIIP
jgi:hypothetical protein